MTSDMEDLLQRTRDVLEKFIEAQNVRSSDVGEIESNKAKILEGQVSSLHNKVDKIIRQLEDLSENQKKMSKTISTLQKLVESSASLSGSKRKATGNDMNSSSVQDVKKAKLASESNSVVSTVPGKGAAENGWATNMLLVGDRFWKRLREIDDIDADIQDLERDGNFHINSKENRRISDLFDPDRNKVLFALPQRISKIVISVGWIDLLDSNLYTLEDGSLNEIRKHNTPILYDKARTLIQLFRNLLNSQKSVAYLLPPCGKERLEIFKHWEDIIQQEVFEIESSNFRVVNLPAIMRQTVRDYPSHDKYIDAWFSSISSQSEPLLTAYGCRRLFDLIRRSVKKPPTSKDNGEKCLRCLKSHAGLEAKCKSIEMRCRLCEEVGHFKEIHNVEDLALRERITAFFGKDMTKSANSYGISNALNDWYSV